LTVLHPQAAGIDVHCDMHMVCVPAGSVSPRPIEPGGLPPQVRRFGANTCDLQAVAAWLRECGVTTVAMESTGVYWIPLFELLESRGFEVWLVEPGQLARCGARPKTDVLDEDKSQWFVTPNKSFADFTALSHLPESTVRTKAVFAKNSGGTEATVTLTNESDHLAFFIEMKILGAKSQQPLTPVFWDDNYVSLPPHATKTFHAQFPAGEEPKLKLQSWNVKFKNAD